LRSGASPGPGTYDLRSSFDEKRGGSIFGTEKRGADPKIKDKMNSPGPGSYTISFSSRNSGFAPK
jgi:hypothetical protein